MRDAYIFDPADEQWHVTGKLATQRAGDVATGRDIEKTGGKWYPTLITLPDGCVLAVSGHPEMDDSRHNNNSLELYDPATGVWSIVGPVDYGNIDTVDARRYEYPRLHVLPDGTVISMSPMANRRLEKWHPYSDATDWDDVIGPPPEFIYDNWFAQDTTSVLLPLSPSDKYRARIMVVGGSRPYIHNFNPDQRHITLEFKREKGDVILANVPPEPNVAIMGYYLLFVIDSTGRPSTGRFVQICLGSRQRQRSRLDIEVQRHHVRPVHEFAGQLRRCRNVLVRTFVLSPILPLLKLKINNIMASSHYFYRSTRLGPKPHAQNGANSDLTIELKGRSDASHTFSNTQYPHPTRYTAEVKPMTVVFKNKLHTPIVIVIVIVMHLNL